MARPKSKNPTDREMAILRILWDKEPLTVRQVNDIMNQGDQQDQEIGYTSTLKIMQIMVDKGLVRRDKSHRTHAYYAVVAEEHTQKQVVNEMIDKVFGGSAKKLVMQVLAGQEVSDDEMKQIQKILDEKKGQ